MIFKELCCLRFLAVKYKEKVASNRPVGRQLCAPGAEA